MARREKARGTEARRIGFFLLLVLIFSFLFFGQELFSIDDFTSAFVFGKEDFFPSSQKTNSLVQDEGSVEVHFCPRENCEKLFVDFLEQAEFSLHCALYDIGLPSVQEVLLRKKKEGKNVGVITDDAYLKRFRHAFVKADGSYGLMHNKFCIVDGNKVSTGSMNPTAGDAQENNNNLLFISSPLVAQNYENEFAEMWKGRFKSGDITKNPAVRVGETALEILFCPEDGCAEKVQEEIRKAEKSVFFMTFSFTHQGIAEEILFKKLEGVEIKGIMDKTQAAGEYSVFPWLEFQGIEVIKNKKSLLHHKVFIIDGKTVITGSFNPTKGGDERNDENMVIIRDMEIANKYLAEFQRLWNKTEGEK